MMKLISWNVNGLRACVTKGFYDYFKEQDADIFCVQETKLQEGQIALEIGDEYSQYWNYAVKKGYSGGAGRPYSDTGIRRLLPRERVYAECEAGLVPTELSLGVGGSIPELPSAAGQPEAGYRLRRSERGSPGD